MVKYEAVIGLEIHMQINTKRKAFCDCKTDFGELQNSNICPVCTGQPGALPVLNNEFVKKAILFSKAIDCDINLESTFDRKNYFYPDLPKGYQITQFFKPIGENGQIMVHNDKGDEKTVTIERVHMEEDTGKSFHRDDVTLLNFNRCGVPLIEVVSNPDLRTGKEAYEYFKKIYMIAVKYLGICNGNMENGNLRCDANVSIRPVGSKELFTKTEVKNVNSFSFIQKAIDYEIERQTALVISGGEVKEETRLWNSKLKQTEMMRKKAGRNDYRYFNEPDLAPLRINQTMVNSTTESMPELPDARYHRLKEKYGINEELLELMIGYPKVSDYFEESVKEYEKGTKKIASWISSELLRLEDKEKLENATITPKMIAELVSLIDDKKINQSQAKEIIEIMHKKELTASEVVKSDSRFQAMDSSLLESIVDQVINENTKQLEAYLAGKEQLYGFFVGQTMKISKGKADPGEVNRLLKTKLSDLKK